MALFYGAHVASSDNLDFLERLHCRAARFIFNLPKDMASHGVLERAEWFTIRFYNGRLPSTLTNCIAKKLNLSLLYPPNACTMPWIRTDKIHTLIDHVLLLFLSTSYMST